MSMGVENEMPEGGEGVFSALFRNDGPEHPRKLPERLSKESYEKRLLTFQPSTYFAKPAIISPLVCARFGWTNALVDTLVCDTCEATLKIVFHPQLKQTGIQKIAAIYKQRLCTAHESICPFWSNEFPVDQVACAVPSYLATVLPERAVELMENPAPARLLHVSIKEWADVLNGESLDVTLPEDVQSKISSLVVEDNDDNGGLTNMIITACGLEPSKINETCVLLALFGWSPVEQTSSDGPKRAKCTVCRAEAHVPFQQPRAEAEAPPQTKKRRATMNLVSSHRHYCPFVCGFPTGKSAEPMWDVISKNVVRSNTKSSASGEGESSETVLAAVQHMLRSGIVGKTVIDGKKHS